jgi:hypothetical protein
MIGLAIGIPTVSGTDAPGQGTPGCSRTGSMMNAGPVKAFGIRFDPAGSFKGPVL